MPSLAEKLGFRFHHIISIEGGALEGQLPRSVDGVLYENQAAAGGGIAVAAQAEVDRRKALYEEGEVLPEDLTVEAVSKLLEPVEVNPGEHYRPRPRPDRTIRTHGVDDGKHQL